MPPVVIYESTHGRVHLVLGRSLQARNGKMGESLELSLYDGQGAEDTEMRYEILGEANVRG